MLTLKLLCFRKFQNVLLIYFLSFSCHQAISLFELFHFRFILTPLLILISYAKPLQFFFFSPQQLSYSEDLLKHYFFLCDSHPFISYYYLVILSHLFLFQIHLYCCRFQLLLVFGLYFKNPLHIFSCFDYSKELINQHLEHFHHYSI